MRPKSGGMCTPCNPHKLRLCWQVITTTCELHDIEQKFIVPIQDSVVASCSQKKSASSIYYNYTLQQLHVYKDEPTL